MKKYSPHPKHYSQPAGHLRSQGFTLVELMLSIVILGILLSVGGPHLVDRVQDGRLIAQSNGIRGMIGYARSEAVKRPVGMVTLCASRTVNSASPACDTNDWEEGWFAMVDLNGDQILDNINEDLNLNGVLDGGEDINGNGQLDSATDFVLRIGNELDGGNTLRTTGFLNEGFIQFDSSGLPGTSGTLTLCDDRGVEHAKAIILSIAGHVRAAVDEEDAPDNIVNDHRGTDVVCPL